jgi:hypothetical protein
MNSKSKLTTLAIVAAVGVATPALAFAQALQTGTAANREQLFGYGSSPSQFLPYYGGQADLANGLGAYAEVPRVTGHAPRSHRRRWRHGLRAFDMVPGAAFDPESPAATGGGNLGYNTYNGRDS